MRKLLLILGLSLGLAGCMQDQVINVARPADDKSIMVPAGLVPPAQQIKSVFGKAGWEKVLRDFTIEACSIKHEQEFIKLLEIT